MEPDNKEEIWSKDLIFEHDKPTLEQRVKRLEEENKDLISIVKSLRAKLNNLSVGKENLF